MQGLIPPPLLKGDTIGVVAPAGSVNKNLFDKGIEIIQNMGFKLYIPDDIFDIDRYFAGSDYQRAKNVNKLFATKEIKGIICARGGYGSARILSFLNYDLISTHPKRFVGFSDVTALLDALNQRCKFVTWHGPVITTLANGCVKTRDSLYLSLTEVAFRKIVVQGGVTIRGGKTTGKLIGGNLTTLCHLTGTFFEPVYKNKILFFEDINEPPYKIDRMFTQLKLSNRLKKISGVVLGSFENCGDIKDIYSIIEDVFDEHIPIFAGLKSGHGKENITIPIGLETKMDADRCELIFI